MHICVVNLTTTGSDKGLSSGQHQAIIWTNAGMLFIRPLGMNISEILIKIHTFKENAFETVIREMSAILARPQCVEDKNPMLLIPTDDLAIQGTILSAAMIS